MVCSGCRILHGLRHAWPGLEPIWEVPLMPSVRRQDAAAPEGRLSSRLACVESFGIESRFLSWHAVAHMSHLNRAREVFDIELAGLKAVRTQLDQVFDRAVELIVHALRQ